MYLSMIELIDYLNLHTKSQCLLTWLWYLWRTNSIFHKELPWILSTSTDMTPLPCDHRSASFQWSTATRWKQMHVIAETNVCVAPENFVTRQEDAETRWGADGPEFARSCDSCGKQLGVLFDSIPICARLQRGRFSSLLLRVWYTCVMFTFWTPLYCWGPIDPGNYGGFESATDKNCEYIKILYISGLYVNSKHDR